MMRRAAGMVLIVAATGLLLRAELTPEARTQALKMIATLEKLGQDKARHPSRPGGSYTLTEAELNTWIAYRISTEMERFVRTCELRLQDGNRAEGKLVIDLSSTPASAVLPSRVEMYFSASAETQNGKIRITMENLFLGNQRLPPSFIDTVIAIVAGLEGQPATSLHDWYPLPYGIQRLESQAGRLVCYF